MSIIARVPEFLKKFNKNLTWEIKTEERKVFLTFDDGPTPEVTSWVLDQLESYNAKATFFCLGKNVEAHPDLYSEILRRGHVVGNHSYSHLKGYRSSKEAYLQNAMKAKDRVDSTLFRPPYGRIRPAQIRALSREFDIILWSVLSVDYNPKISPQHVANNVKRHLKPGSIIVFHDSLKASNNLYGALPEVLEHLKEEGYMMEGLNSICGD